ncbi:MAG TPA: cyclic nucleotide-binding domain-containing protein [Burkholderiaceae bacterium]|nr:cyclic nucleotide-binding domain-containing protein [Burkholderiaceae bacterium]
MSTAIEQQLQGMGLELVGHCGSLAERGPQLLQRCALLEGFTTAEANTLGAAMLLVRAQPGQTLIAEGDLGDWMLILLSGTVDVTKRAVSDEVLAQARGEPSRLSVIRTGATVGEMSMLDGEPRYATCTALEPVEAGVLTRNAIAQLIREQPAVGAKLLLRINQQLAQRLRNTSTQLVRLLQKR